MWDLNYKQKTKEGEDDVAGLLELKHTKGNYKKAGSKITLRNTEGMFTVVDGAKADNQLKEGIVFLIDEAYEEGNPFGKDIRSKRPIQNEIISDPISGEAISKDEIKRLISELISEGKIEFHKSEKGNIIRAVEFESPKSTGGTGSTHKLK
jgi:hypothetical protein